MAYTFGRTAVLLITALLTAQFTATAWAAETMSLEEVVTAAVGNNPAVIEAQKRWEEKNSQIPIATALPNPKIGVMKDEIPNGTLNPGQGMMTEYTVSQEFMGGGKLGLMGKMAANDALMAKGVYRDKMLQTYVDAKQVYYDVLYAAKAVEIGKENQQLMGQLAQLAQVNYSTGMIPLQDTLKAQTEFSKMTVDLLAMASMEAVAKAKLNTVMGRPADSALTIKEEFNAPPPNFDLAALVSGAQTAKPSLQGMQSQLDMAQTGIALAKKQSLPDYEVQLGYKNSRDMYSPSGWKIGLMAMIPLWQDKNKAQVTAAQANLDAMHASYRNMVNMTGLDVQMALVEAQTAWRQTDLYKNTIVPQAEQAYQASVISYTNGKADFMTVLDSLTTLKNAKLGYYKAKTDYEKAASSLEKAVGRPLFGAVSGF
ncbi:MAG: TolC family protein [Negativicutes bacterium]|nr:TolC family protein [Negativicutes bacterium]